jgi:hypothetical protein
MARIVGRRPVEIKISSQLDGYIPVFNESTRLWNTISKNDFLTGSALTSGSNIFAGNQIISGSLTVIQGITGSLFGTASYADNAWAIGGNTFSGGNSSRILGTFSNHDLSIFVSGSKIATFTTLGSLVLTSGSVDGLEDSKLAVYAGTTTSHNLIRATSNTDGYSHISIQNTNSGSNASSNIVAIADNGSNISRYINVGINSSTFTGSVGGANDAYLYSTSNNLHIGNASNYPVQFFAGGANTDTNRKLQLNPNNLHNMTGSLDVSGSVTAHSFTGSLQGSSSYALTSSYADNFTVAGTLTAQTIVAQTITSSTEFITGSTKNGSLLTNTHQFTGSVSVTGSLEVNGRNYINDSSSLADRITTNSSSFVNFSGSYVNESSSFADRIRVNSSSFADFSGSYINESASFATRITTNSSSFVSFSGSYINESSSLAGRITTNSSSFVSFSGSYVNESSSLAGRITTNSSSFASFSGSYINESSSFAGRVTTNSSSFVNFSGSYVSESSSFADRIRVNSSSFAGFSGSYVNESSSFTGRITINSSSFALFSGSYVNESSSFASRIITNSASISTLSSNFNLFSGSFMTGSFTGSFTGSISGTSSYATQALTASNATTASSADNFTVRGTLTAQTIVAQTITSSIEFVTGSTKNGSLLSNTHQFTGSVSVTGSLEVNGRNYITDSSSFAAKIAADSASFTNFSGSYINESASFANRITTNSSSFAIFSGSHVIESASFDSRIKNISSSFTTLSGSFNTGSFTGSFTGSLFGTASNAVTASYVLNAISASFASNTPGISNGTASNAISASYAATASSADNLTVRGTLTAQTINVQTITSSIEFVTGSTRNGSLLTNTHQFTGSVLMTGSLAVNGSSTILTNQTSSMSVATASYVLQAVSASFASNTPGISNGTASNAATASYVVTAQTASYVLNAVSSSFAATASSADNFTVRGTLTAQTIVAQTITSSIEFVTGSTRNGSLLVNTHQFTGSVLMTGSLSVNGDQTLSGSLNIVPTSGNKGIVVTVNTGNNGVIQQGLAGSYTFAIDGANGGGPRLGLGSSPSAGYDFFQIGAYGGENNFDTVTRNFSIRSTISSTNDTRFKLFANTGNVLIQNGGTFTDAGFRLDVAGTTRLNGAVTVASASIQSQNTSSLASGTQTISTNATSSFTAAFYNYTIASGSNTRAGQFIATWNGGSIQYMDNSTVDIGSTLPVALTASLSGANVLLTSTLPSTGWTIKTLVNLI